MSFLQEHVDLKVVDEEIDEIAAEDDASPLLFWEEHAAFLEEWHGLTKRLVVAEHLQKIAEARGEEPPEDVRQTLEAVAARMWDAVKRFFRAVGEKIIAIARGFVTFKRMMSEVNGMLKEIPDAHSLQIRVNQGDYASFRTHLKELSKRMDVLMREFAVFASRVGSGAPPQKPNRLDPIPEFTMKTTSVVLTGREIGANVAMMAAFASQLEGMVKKAARHQKVAANYLKKLEAKAKDVPGALTVARGLIGGLNDMASRVGRMSKQVNAELAMHKSQLTRMADKARKTPGKEVTDDE